MTILPARPLQSNLETELTTGFYGSEGIPRSLIVESGNMSRAEDLVRLNLARWDDDQRYGELLKAKPALWKYLETARVVA